MHAKMIIVDNKIKNTHIFSCVIYHYTDDDHNIITQTNKHLVWEFLSYKLNIIHKCCSENYEK